MGRLDQRSHLDRLTDAASLLLEGRSVEDVTAATGVSVPELEDLRRRILRLGVGSPSAAGGGLRRSGAFLARLGAALGWKQGGAAANSVPVTPGEAPPPEASGWGAWHPVPAVVGIEARVAREAPRRGAEGFLWLYEFRSTLPAPETFRFRIAVEAGGDYPRSVRALRPGEIIGGMVSLNTDGPVWVGTAMPG
jgi:hypothetical protein